MKTISLIKVRQGYALELDGQIIKTFTARQLKRGRVELARYGGVYILRDTTKAD